MAEIKRLRVLWQGIPVVGNGLSTFYTAGSGATLPGDVKAFFLAVKATFPSGITWTIPGGGDVIETTNGQLTGAWTGTGGGTQVSGGTGTNFVQGAGGRIRWTTTGIYRGHRVVGTTFMAPLVSDYWEGAAAISSVATGNWSSAANALLAAQPLLSIYSRKVVAKPLATPPVVGSDGQHNVVNGVIIPDQTSWLRSRRV